MTQQDQPVEISPHLLLLMVFGISAQLAIGSVALKLVLEEIAADILSIDIAKLKPEERTVAEWKAFFVAMGCAGCDMVGPFEDLMKSDLIQDPALYLMAMPFAMRLRDSSWLDSATRSTADGLYKRLSKSVKKNQQYIKGISKSEPILLPSPDNSEA